MEIVVKSPFCWLFFSLLPTPAGASGRWQASCRFPGWVSRGVAEGGGLCGQLAGESELAELRQGWEPCQRDRAWRQTPRHGQVL